jgi:hypothetical protein
MIEAQRSSETLVLTRATRRNIPEDGILQLHYEFICDLAPEDMAQGQDYM